jgi:hypothetical protein
VDIGEADISTIALFRALYNRLNRPDHVSAADTAIEYLKSSVCFHIFWAGPVA